MVRKEDVVSWFRELESYKRIDAMCTLLNMCLPFELRFVGTFLEELCKRDFQELRGAELRANCAPELTADVGSGAASDPRTRRKMALYVSLLRSCNFACASTLYEWMVTLERSGLLSTLHGDMLEEILLLYTMALHHPAFTFDEKSHFGEILDKLKPEERRIEAEPVAVPTECLVHAPNLSVPPPSLPAPPGLVYVKAPVLQGPPSSNEQAAELGSPGVPMPGPGMAILSEVHHPPPGLPLPQYTDYMVAQPPWPGNLIVPAMNPTLEQVMNYPSRASSSPLVASPADSRPGSPRAPHRRTSRDRVSPPAPPPVDTHNPLPTLIPNFENLTVSEMRRMDDDRLREIGVSSNVVAQLRSVEKLNGVVRRTGASCPPPGPGPGPGRTSGSESGSSGGGSPPGTPAPPPRRGPPVPPPAGPYSYLPFPRAFPAYPAPHPAPHNAYRPPPPAYANGEPFAPGHYASFVPLLYAPPKQSCWNCGSTGHVGHDCKEPSMEEITRAGGYQLDFGSAPPEPGEQ